MKIRWLSLFVSLAFVMAGCAPSQTNAAEFELPLSSLTQEPPSTLIPAQPTQEDTPQADPLLPLSSPTREPLSTLLLAQPTQGEEPLMNPFLPTPSVSGLEGLIEKAKEDLAQRLSIPVSDIILVEAKEVVWSDGSLGCPQPGMMYAQVLTPGYLVKFKYDIRDFEYHAGKDRSLTYCKNPLPPVEGAPGDT